jgi:patatin-like phospholipase/acyl hydrolase
MNNQTEEKVMTRRVILQVDGGGILGITPAIVLDELEKRIGKGKAGFLLRDVLTLCCGTSTGAIIAGFVVAGVAADKIRNFYLNDGVTLFKNSMNPIYTRLYQPKFKRQPFLDTLDDILGRYGAAQNGNINLSDLPRSTQFMATAYKLCSHRTHFVKSDDKHDQDFTLRRVISWSALSAAYYFGKIKAEDYTWDLVDNSSPPKSVKKVGAVFQDGGQGTQNCTLDFVLTEILCHSLWDNDEIVIISLGTGGCTKFDSYDDAKNIVDIGQTVKYLLNQAREESTVVQKLAASYVETRRSNVKLFRLDYETEKDYSLDDTEHVAVYEQGARDIVNSAPFNTLVGLLTH